MTKDEILDQIDAADALIARLDVHTRTPETFEEVGDVVEGARALRDSLSRLARAT